MKKEVVLCDVFGLERGVGHYAISIVDAAGGVVTSRAADWSERALERALRLVERACTPPPKRTKAAKA